MKTPHASVKSLDTTEPHAFFTTRAPKRGETPFISKGRRSMFDSDVPLKRDKIKREKRAIIEKPALPFRGKSLEDGSFRQIYNGAKGKFATRLFDSSLMKRLNGEKTKKESSFGLF